MITKIHPTVPTPYSPKLPVQVRLANDLHAMGDQALIAARSKFKPRAEGLGYFLLRQRARAIAVSGV